MPLSLHAAARSDVGLVRSNNQDSAYAGVRFLVVADGMGGHAGGDVASSVAVGELIGLDDEAHGADAPQQLERAIVRAQEALLRRVSSDPSLAGMGTTVTALLRSGDRLVLGHLGDSRGYLLHQGVLTQVTRDHTFVQRLVDEGRITAEQAERHPQRNVILRVLGDVQSSPEADISVRTAEVGDRWLLCSDGLPRVVSDETIAQTLSGVRELGACADRLVQLALRGGAPDNVTCVVADVVEDGDAPPGAPQVVGSAALDHPQGSAATASPAARAAHLRRRGSSGAGAAGGTAAPDAAGAAAVATSGAGTGGPGAEPGGDRARPRWGRRVGVLVLVVAVLGGGVLAATAWLHRQYYVGPSAGRVAIFRGLSQDVAGIGLSSVVRREDVRVADLPPVFRDRVAKRIAATDLADARRIVSQLRDEAAPPPPPPPTPTDAPTGVPTGVPTGAPSGAPSGSPGPGTTP